MNKKSIKFLISRSVGHNC